MDWAASCLTLLSVFLMRKKLSKAHLVAISGAFLWIAYALPTQAYALASLNGIFVFLGVWNYRTWKADERKAAALLLAREGPGASITHGRCCAMARKFDCGIVRELPGEMPSDAVDHILNWRVALKPGFAFKPTKDGKALPSSLPDKVNGVLFVPSYCMWCGAHIRRAVESRNPPG